MDTTHEIGDPPAGTAQDHRYEPGENEPHEQPHRASTRARARTNTSNTSTRNTRTRNTRTNTNNTNTTPRIGSRWCPGCRSSATAGSASRLSDRWVHRIFLLLGIGVLVPWNAFVSAKPYFTARLCQESESESESESSGSDSDSDSYSDIVNFEQWCGLIYNLSSVCSLGLIILGQSFVDYWKKTTNPRALVDTEDTEDVDRSHLGSSSIEDNNNNNERGRGQTDGCSGSGSFYNVVLPLGLCASVFFGQAVLVAIPNVSPLRFLLATFLGLAVCGVSTAIATAGVVAVAGNFPARIGINPFFSGQALGGAAVCIVNFAVVALGEDPAEYTENHCAATTTATTATTTTTTTATNDRLWAQALPVSASLSNAIQRSLPELDQGNSGSDSDSDSECSPYQRFDGAVALYFVAGFVVLVLCQVGFHAIVRHCQCQCECETNGGHGHVYRDDDYNYNYETVEGAGAHGNGNHHDNNNNNNHQPCAPYVADANANANDDDTDDMTLSPRTGLELHERIHRRHRSQYRDHEHLNPGGNSNSYNNSSQQKLHPMALTETTQLTALASSSSSPTGRSRLQALCGGSDSGDDDDDDDGDDDDDEFRDDDGEEHTTTITAAADTGTGGDPESMKSVVWAVKGPAACVFLTFAVTLSLFPSWVSELKSSHECESEWRLDNDLYIPFCFVVYNIGDLLGRLLSGYVPVDRIRHLSRKLVVCALLRVVFVPLFFVCNNTTIGSDTTSDTTSGWVVRNDFFSLLVQMFFAVSNGLLISTAFMFSPLPVGATPIMQERASKIMSFSLSFGLMIGSFLAFPLLELFSWIIEQ